MSSDPSSEPEELSPEEASRLLSGGPSFPHQRPRRAVSVGQTIVRRRARPRPRASLMPMLVGLAGSFGMLALVIFLGRASAPDDAASNSYQMSPAWSEKVAKVQRDRRADEQSLASLYKDLGLVGLEKAKERAIDHMGLDYERLLTIESTLAGEPSEYVSREQAAERGAQLREEFDVLRQLSKLFMSRWKEECEALRRGPPPSSKPSVGSAKPSNPVAPRVAAARSEPSVAQAKELPSSRAAPPANGSGAGQEQGPALAALPTPGNTALVLCYRPLPSTQAARIDALALKLQRTAPLPTYAQAHNRAMDRDGSFAVDVGGQEKSEFVASIRAARNGRGYVEDLLAPYALRLLEGGVLDHDIVLHVAEALARLGAVDLAVLELRRLAARLAEGEGSDQAAGLERVLSRIPARKSLGGADKEIAWLSSACRSCADALVEGEPLAPGWLISTRRTLLDEDYHAALRAGDTDAIESVARSWAVLDDLDPIPSLVLGMCWVSGRSPEDKEESSNAVVRDFCSQIELLFDARTGDKALSERMRSLRLVEIGEAHGCEGLPYPKWLHVTGGEFFFPLASWTADQLEKVGRGIGRAKDSEKQHALWLEQNPDHPSRGEFEKELSSIRADILRYKFRIEQLSKVADRQSLVQFGGRGGGSAKAGRNSADMFKTVLPNNKGPVRSVLNYGERVRVDGAKRRRESVPRNAVARALSWLARYQDDDGRWDAADFGRHDVPGDKASNGRGNPVHDVGVTGLAVLAFVGDGRDLNEPEYGILLQRAASWLQAQQQENGLIGTNAAHDFVYDHAIAMYALAELCALHPSEALRQSVGRATSYLEAHRNPEGVWRYQPRDNDNDLCVTAWCVSALISASHAGVPIDPKSIRCVETFLDRVSDASGKHGYTKAGEGSSRKPGDHGSRFPINQGEALTAAGLQCRCILGQSRRPSSVMEAAARRLKAKPPLWGELGSIDFYYWYYGSVALSQMGGDEWKVWRSRLLSVLPVHQHDSSSGRNLEGSWDPVGPWGEDGGRVYSTALGALALEATYRK